MGNPHQPATRDATQYHVQAERKLDAFLSPPAPNPDRRVLQVQAKAWCSKFFVFMTDRRILTINNISEREILSSVVCPKIINGFRSDWGAGVHAEMSPSPIRQNSMPTPPSMQLEPSSQGTIPSKWNYSCQPTEQLCANGQQSVLSENMATLVNLKRKLFRQVCALQPNGRDPS
jgi:transposase